MASPLQLIIKICPLAHRMQSFFPNPAINFIIMDFSLLYKTATLQLIDLAAASSLSRRSLPTAHRRISQAYRLAPTFTVFSTV
ncbi:MAG: hypothetical protein WBK40_00620 [Bacteroidales bacterium]|nr:hypothetical protein [Lentimicrobium sp.]